MGVDVLLAPAEKTGVRNAVRTAKHKQNETNNNLSSLCHDAAKAIASSSPAHRGAVLAMMSKCMTSAERLSQQLSALHEQNEEMGQHRFLTAEAKRVISTRDRTS